MKVLKFGGSSVAQPERIERIVKILKDYYTQGEEFTVVFSAFGGVTDSLIAMSQAAEKGQEEEYLQLVEFFSQRHTSAVKTLLNESTQQKVLPELLDYYQTL